MHELSEGGRSGLSYCRKSKRGDNHQHGTSAVEDLFSPLSLSLFLSLVLFEEEKLVRVGMGEGERKSIEQKQRGREMLLVVEEKESGRDK